MRRANALLLLLALLLVGCSVGEGPSLSPRASGASSAAPSPPTTTATPPPSVTPPPSPAAGPNEGGAFLALGDSVTFGVGVPQPRRDGFPARLANRLATADPPVSETRVLAVPGETASGFLEARLDDVLVAIDELGDRVELVTIGLGANELLRSRRDPACQADPSGAACTSTVDEATSSAAAALDDLVARVQDALAAAGSSARIILLAYYNPDVEPIATAAVAGSDGVVGCDRTDPSPGLNDKISCVAEARGVELVDLHAAFLGREDELTQIAAGDVHPNAAGYAVIADELAMVLGLDEEAS